MHELLRVSNRRLGFLLSDFPLLDTSATYALLCRMVWFECTGTLEHVLWMFGGVFRKSCLAVFRKLSISE